MQYLLQIFIYKQLEKESIIWFNYGQQNDSQILFTSQAGWFGNCFNFGH